MQPHFFSFSKGEEGHKFTEFACISLFSLSEYDFSCFIWSVTLSVCVLGIIMLRERVNK